MDDFQDVVRSHGIGGRGKRVENWGNGAHNITKAEINSGNNQYMTITTKPQVKGFIDQSTVFTHDIFGAVPGNVRAGQKFGGNSGGITEMTGTFTVDATAVAADMLSGKTAGINGNMVTGTMPIQNGEYYRDNWTLYDPGGGPRVYMKPPRGYYAGGGGAWTGDNAVYSDGQPYLYSQYIVGGASIFNVSGTAKRWAQANGTLPNGTSTVNLYTDFTPGRATCFVTYTDGLGNTWRKMFFANSSQSINYRLGVRTEGTLGTTALNETTMTSGVAIFNLGESVNNISYYAFAVEA